MHVDHWMLALAVIGQLAIMIGGYVSIRERLSKLEVHTQYQKRAVEKFNTDLHEFMTIFGMRGLPATHANRGREHEND